MNNYLKYKRQRYLLFSFIAEKKDEINEKLIINLLWNSISRYFGVNETSKTGLWLVELNTKEGWGIIRFAHTSKENLITSIGMIRFVHNTRITLYPLKISGTIKKTKKVLNGLSEEQLITNYE